MKEPTMKRVNGSEVAINVAVWEGREGPVLCIHGITSNCRCWDLLARRMSPAYRILAMDLRGRGRSEKPETGYSLDHHTRDIHCVLDRLGVERAVIMGHSLGAFVGLGFAAKHPDRAAKLILVDGGGELPKEMMEKVLAGIKPSTDRLGRVYPDVEAYISRIRQAGFIQPWSAVVEDHYRYELERTESGVRPNIDPVHVAEEAANLSKFDTAGCYAKVACRVLILRATEPLSAGGGILLPEGVVDRMLREMPQARCIEVPGTDHYGILFQPHPERDLAIFEFLQDSSAASETAGETAPGA